jgi:hypothetical protein
MSTLAIMFTVSTYGTWLRGDARGWIDDGILFPPDPQLEQADREQMKYPPYHFPRHARQAVGQAMGDALTNRLSIMVLAMCVQSWHSHFITAATQHDVTEVVKCAKDAARWHLRLDRPIWAADFDKRFCFTPWLVRKRIDYVERHNLEDGLPRCPWEFIREWHEPPPPPRNPR